MAAILFSWTVRNPYGMELTAEETKWYFFSDPGRRQLFDREKIFVFVHELLPLDLFFLPKSSFKPNYT